MQNSVAVVEDVQIENSAPAQVWREYALSGESVFQGEDELGRKGWFLRLEMTGLFPRRCGPFETREKTVAVLDQFLSKLVPDALCELQNDMALRYVIEGIPRLTATSNER